MKVKRAILFSLFLNVYFLSFTQESIIHQAISASSYSMNEGINLRIEKENSKKNMWLGGAIGTGAGLIAAFSVKAAWKNAGTYDSSKSSHQLGFWNSQLSISNGELERTMAFAPQLFIIATGTIVGLLIGKSKDAKNVASITQLHVGVRDSKAYGLSLVHKF